MRRTPARILMTADPLGGVWTYAVELARALQPSGVQMALATMGGRLSASQKSELQLCRNTVVFESDYALEWMDEPWTDVDRAGDWLLQIADRFGPDVIHLNGYTHAALPWDAPVLLTAHSCVFSWWRAVKKAPPPAKYDEYSRRVAAGLRAASVIVAPTRAMRASLLEEYGVERDVRVITNAICRKRLAPAPKKPVIFAAGRIWDEAKNMAAVDEAAARVLWPVEIAGCLAHPSGCSLKLKNAVALGELTRQAVLDHLGHAAIAALPARYEPFGLSALEAALCSCALVLGDIPSLRELWDEDAIFVPPDDPEALAVVLNALIANANRREEYGLRARARALRFSPTDMARQYLQAYADSLARQQSEVVA